MLRLVSAHLDEEVRRALLLHMAASSCRATAVGDGAKEALRVAVVHQTRWPPAADGLHARRSPHRCAGTAYILSFTAASFPSPRQPRLLAGRVHPPDTKKRAYLPIRSLPGRRTSLSSGLAGHSTDYAVSRYILQLDCGRAHVSRWQGPKMDVGRLGLFFAGAPSPNSFAAVHLSGSLARGAPTRCAQRRCGRWQRSSTNDPLGADLDQRSGGHGGRPTRSRSTSATSS